MASRVASVATTGSHMMSARIGGRGNCLLATAMTTTTAVVTAHSHQVGHGAQAFLAQLHEKSPDAEAQDGEKGEAQGGRIHRLLQRRIFSRAAGRLSKKDGIPAHSPQCGVIQQDRKEEKMRIS